MKQNPRSLGCAASRLSRHTFLRMIQPPTKNLSGEETPEMLEAAQQIGKRRHNSLAMGVVIAASVAVLATGLGCRRRAVLHCQRQGSVHCGESGFASNGFGDCSSNGCSWAMGARGGNRAHGNLPLHDSCRHRPACSGWCCRNRRRSLTCPRFTWSLSRSATPRSPFARLLRVSPATCFFLDRSVLRRLVVCRPWDRRWGGGISPSKSGPSAREGKRCSDVLIWEVLMARKAQEKRC